MSPRTMADRLDRARQRAQRREALHVLLARIDRLSPAEAALLVDYVRAELDASDHLRATIQGQQNAMQEASDRTRAAEAAIVEAEKDRDRAVAVIGRVRDECDRIEAAVRDNTTSPDLAGGYLACLRHIRAALDERQDQP